MEATADPEIDPGKLASCVRAWCDADLRISERRMLGRPKPVDAANAKPRGKAKPDPAKFTEPQ